MDELKAAIMAILDQRISEADNGGSAIEPNDLMELLSEDFELSYYELCQGLNSLAVDSMVGYTLTSKLFDALENSACIVEKIYAIPPKEKTE